MQQKKPHITGAQPLTIAAEPDAANVSQAVGVGWKTGCWEDSGLTQRARPGGAAWHAPRRPRCLFPTPLTSGALALAGHASEGAATRRPVNLAVGVAGSCRAQHGTHRSACTALSGWHAESARSPQPTRHTQLTAVLGVRLQVHAATAAQALGLACSGSRRGHSGLRSCSLALILGICAPQAFPGKAGPFHLSPTPQTLLLPPAHQRRRRSCRQRRRWTLGRLSSRCSSRRSG